MENNVPTNAGQGFGIAALVLGIITIITAVIPCVGIIALIPGILGIIFAVVALVQANRNQGAKALIIVALVLSSLGTAISTVWVLAFSTPAIMSHSVIKTFDDIFDFDDLSRSFENLDKKIEKSIEEGEGTYTITIKKTFTPSQDSLVKKLEELEGGDSLITTEEDTIIRK